MPPKFNFSADDWKRWDQAFRIYLHASDKDKESNQAKICALLNCLGNDGIEIFNTFDQDLTKAFVEWNYQAFFTIIVMHR